MLSIFYGLTVANLMTLCGVFGLGWFAVAADGRPTRWYAVHVGMGIAAGLLTLLTHVAVYTYMMATTKWLSAATDKAGMDDTRVLHPARRRKARSLPVVLGAIGATVLAMFAGAGADPTVNPWWSGQAHMVVALVAIVANGCCAVLEYGLIKEQGADVDEALGVLNRGEGAGMSGGAVGSVGVVS